MGLVTTIGSMLGLCVQTPIGAAINITRSKRGIINLSLAVLAMGAIVIFLFPSFWPVAIANTLMAMVGDVFSPAVAAITLGLYSRRQLANRMGRNSAVDHAGNAAIGVLSIPAKALDHDKARDLKTEPGEDGKLAGAATYRNLIRSRPLLVFAAAVLLFNLANTALLPLVGQKLALAHPKEATMLMSACTIAALPIRAVLYTLSDNTAWLIGVQLLDGIGAGVLGALTPLLIADIMRGTGRYNLAQGAIATAQGIGGAVSGLAAGVIVDHAGYTPTFLCLGAAAALALAVFAMFMPETANGEERLELAPADVAAALADPPAS